MRNRTLGIPVLLVLLSAAASRGEESPILFQDDFESGAERWQPTDPAAWRIVAEEGHGQVYNQFQLSKYQPPHRSPHNISLVRDLEVGELDFRAKLKSTNTKAGAHRDMCVFFGYQDPAHFYYVHLGQKPDPHSSQIFIVNGADRKMITENQSPGVPWTDGWHAVRVVRKPADGLIEIYFDDMAKPILTAHDRTFAWGRVGIGSFDDHGLWDDVIVSGKKAERPAQEGSAP